jgi:transcription elongation factor GreA
LERKGEPLLGKSIDLIDIFRETIKFYDFMSRPFLVLGVAAHFFLEPTAQNQKSEVEAQAMTVERIPMTHVGVLRLREQVKRLKTIEKPKNIRDIEEARAHGDLSENAEYHAAKERQGQLDAEIRHLDDILGRAEVIDVSKLSGDRIVFGATVELEDEAGHGITYRLVGEYEADIKRGLLSVTSPIARALIGREIGDTVQVQAPGGLKEYEIMDVRFEDFDAE